MKRASWTAVAVVGALLFASGCGGSAETSAPTAAPSPAATLPPPSASMVTIRACEAAKAAISDGGDTQLALETAALSEQEGIQQIVSEYLAGETAGEVGRIRAYTGAMRIHTWCLRHDAIMP